jgi:hypothetical protein
MSRKSFDVDVGIADCQNVEKMTTYLGNMSTSQQSFLMPTTYVCLLSADTGHEAARCGILFYVGSYTQAMSGWVAPTPHQVPNTDI